MGNSLNRKLLIGTAVGLVTISLVFFILFAAMYQAQLAQERGHASVQINRLLQVSLENAMLKRDLDGLREIVTRLGDQKEIVSVSILNPQHEIRFGSEPGALGSTFPLLNTTKQTDTSFTLNTTGREVLRSVNVVNNKHPCTNCHGPVESNPVNGILIVDYDAAPIRRQVQMTTLLLMGSGAIVVFVVLSGGWWFMRRFVLKPVKQLEQASLALSSGHLDTRVVLNSDDELGQLGKVFNQMAENLQDSLEEISGKEAFVQALIDANPDGVRVIDEDYNIVKTNRAYLEQHAPVQTDLEKSAKCYSSSHGRESPCAATLITCPLHEIRNNQATAIKTTHRHVRSDRSEFWAEIYAAPLMSSNERGDKHLYIVESIRNLDQTANLSHEQKLSALGQLASGVAHEIHNPLAAIRLALQSNIRRIEDGALDINQFENYLQLVDKEVDKCIEITERLLKLSIYPSEPPTLVAIHSVIQETLSLLNYEAQELGVEVHLDFDDSDLRTIAADSELRLIILNMAQNAFHAMPNGGHLTVRTKNAEATIQIILEDTGVGIPEKEVLKIFDPFYSRRADSAPGTGLGLTITKSIVDRCDGQVEVNSILGQGTTIVISLPNADQEKLSETGTN